MAFNLNFGGSTAKFWNKFADKWSMGGEGGKLWGAGTNLWRGLKNTPFAIPGHKKLDSATNKLWEGGRIGWQRDDEGGMHHWYMDKSRKLSPIWEGGLTGVGGSTKQFLDWSEDIAMKSSHHLFGTNVGWSDDTPDEDGGGSAKTVAISDAEDPSLINQGNWQRPGTIESQLRREQQMNRGVLAHDLTKNQRGRQTVATV